MSDDSHRKIKSHSTLYNTAHFLNEIIIILLLLSLPLLLGGTPRFVIVSASLISWFTLFLTIAAFYKEKKRIKIPTVSLFFLAVILFTLFQTIPLPHSILKIISPKAYDLRQFVIPPFLHSWWPISLEPRLTLIEFCKLSGYWALLITVVNMFHNESYKKFLRVIFISGCIVAFIGVFQKAIGATKIFGHYSLRQDDYVIFSTFFNANHLAGFLTLTLAAGFAVVVTSQNLGQKLFAYLGLFLTGLVIFLTFSRGGMIGFFIIGYTFIFLYILSQRKTKPGINTEKPLYLVIGLFSITTIIILLTLIQISDEVLPFLRQGFSDKEIIESSLSTEKIKALFSFSKSIFDYPLVGIGKGSFPAVYGQYLDSTFSFNTRSSIAVYVENSFIQPFIDYGIILPSVFLIVFIITAVKILKNRNKHPFFLACLAAIIGIFSHDLVDFSLEMPAIATTTLIIFAILLGESIHDWTKEDPHHANFIYFRLRPKWMIGVSSIICFALIISIPFQSKKSYGNRVYPILPHSQQANAEETLQTLATALSQSPSDFNHSLLYAKYYLREATFDINEATQWLNKALYLNPMIYQNHLLMAKVLYLLGKKQFAITEFRQAISLANYDDIDSIRIMLKELLRDGVLPQDLLKAMPFDENGNPQYKYDLLLAQSIADNHLKESEKLFSIIEHRQQKTFEIQYIKGQAFLNIKEKEKAKNIFIKLSEQFPEKFEVLESLAALHEQEKEYDVAISYLNKAYLQSVLNEFPQVHLLVKKFHIYVELEQFDQALQVLEEWKNKAVTHDSRNKVLQYSRLKSEIEIKKSNYLQAIKELETAMLIDNKNPEWPSRIGNCYEQLKLYHQAITFYSQSLSLEYSKDLQEKITLLKQKM